MSLAWYDDEAGFARELARGRRAEIRVAAELLPLGLALCVGGLEFRGDLSEVPRFKDQADIEVEGRHLLEVKGRDLEFTSPEDYPYPTAYVGAVRRWERRERKPCAVVLLSEPTGAMLVAFTADKATWVKESAPDARRGFVETSLAVPREQLRSRDELVRHLMAGCDAA